MAAVNGEQNGSTQRPLRILVVGAGIGGLMAGVALRSQGHAVEIFEQSRLAQETGAAIHLAPNADGLLRRFGLAPEDIGAVECKGITEFSPEGPMRYTVSLAGPSKMWQHPWNLVHRAHLHSAIKDLATGARGKGRPANLHVASRISSIDPSTATLTLEDGSQFHGDLIVGADGVHSVTRKSIPGGDLKPFDSGKSAFRFLLPTQMLADDDQTRDFVTKDDYMTMWIGKDRRLIMYPCVNKTVMNFVGIHPSTESASDISGYGWQETGSKAGMLQIFDSFGPGVQGILNKVDGDKLKLWKLLDMEKMPSFIHKKLAVIGDAAHPFLPNQGQGGAQAIEDAVSLAAVLPLGTSAGDIPDRMKVYESCRYERAHTIQEFTRISGRDLDESDGAVKLDMQRFSAYNFGHDEWHASCDALRKHLEAANPRLKNQVLYGFALGFGPRSLLATSSPIAPSARFRTYRISFRSSRTYLQTLLPPGLAFASPATNVFASISCTAFENLAWLGGGGHNTLSLRLHGICHTGLDGSKVFGAYIPVLFDNLPEAVTIDRQAIGSPKLFADIDIQSSADGAVISLQSRGQEFGHFEINGLRKDDSSIDSSALQPPKLPVGPPTPPEEGGFTYRYVPSVGHPAKADAEYVVFHPNAEKDHKVSTSETMVATSANIAFQPQDFERLPTLHNVARVLAELPVYGIEKAIMIKGNGEPHSKDPRRLQ